jgi:putative ABC transport system permease protein
MGVFTLARELFNEARIAIRAFRRQPTFFAAGVLTLALALSATIALISIADAVLMRPLPYPRPERLYSLSATMPDSSGRPTPFVLSPAEFVTLCEQATSFEHVEAMTPTEMAMTMGTNPETVRVGSASAGFLHLFGLDPTVGRGYTEGEDRARAPVIVLDGGLWQRRFGSDLGIVGQSITLDGVRIRWLASPGSISLRPVSSAYRQASWLLCCSSSHSRCSSPSTRMRCPRMCGFRSDRE